MIHSSRFEVVRGGSNVPPGMAEMRFMDGYVTDTRLMGVIGLYVHWKVAFYGNPQALKDYYQFFYFETEEYGFEEYASVIIEKQQDINEVHKIESNLFGGLGGAKMPVSEEEMRYLLQMFISFNRDKRLELPGKKEEYIYLVSNPVDFGAKERAAILNKICTPIVNDYQAIHYFMMRVAGKDFSGAAYLIKGNILLNQMETVPIATMVMNTADLREKGSENVYMVETMLDCDDYYLLVISEVTVNRNHQITAYKACSNMRITGQEAAMKLRKSEYVTVYKYNAGPEVFELNCPDIVFSSVVSEQETGVLYLCFCPNNDHVKKRVFRLNDDVEGLFFVSRGQVLAAAYTLTGIMQQEEKLLKGRIAQRLKVTGKYEFKEALIYEYINSGIEDFDEFIDLVRMDNGDDK